MIILKVGLNLQSRYYIRMQPVNIPSFFKGVPYNIICKASDTALQMQESKSSNYKGSRICGAVKDPSLDAQLFLIDKISHENESYQIVSCPSGLVFSEDSKEVHLLPGKQSSSQLFVIQQVPIQVYYDYYWIKSFQSNQKALSMEGILRYGFFDTQNENQMFRFQEVNANATYLNSKVIVNKQSGMAIDVPGSSFEKGEYAIQWDKNGRFNQRWLLVAKGDEVMIQSALNGLFLDIAGESRSQGAKIVLWEKTGNPNQRWKIENVADNLVRIRSVHEPSFTLAVKEDSLDNKAKIICTRNDAPSSYWILSTGLESKLKAVSL